MFIEGQSQADISLSRGTLGELYYRYLHLDSPSSYSGPAARPDLVVYVDCVKSLDNPIVQSGKGDVQICAAVAGQASV